MCSCSPTDGKRKNVPSLTSRAGRGFAHLLLCLLPATGIGYAAKEGVPQFPVSSG